MSKFYMQGKIVSNLIMNKDTIKIFIDGGIRLFPRDFSYQSLMMDLNDIHYSSKHCIFNNVVQDDTNKLQFFTPVFLEMFFSSGHIPSLEEFISFYKKNYLIINKSDTVSPINNKELKLEWKGVNGRITKVYPSLVGELLLVNRLLDELDCECFYDYNEDTLHKKDFCIHNEGKKYAVVMFANSYKAIEYEERRKKIPNNDYTYIKVLRDINGKEIYKNGLSLYGDETVKKIKNEIGL